MLALFPNMEKEIVNQVQEAQRVPGRINPSRNTPRYWQKWKATKKKMTNNIQGNSHHVISWLLNRNSTSQKGMAWYIQSDEREEPTTKNTLPSMTLLQIWWRNQKLSRQAKVKRIQHHQTSFTTNAKGISLGRIQEKEKPDLQKINPEQLRKW